MAEDYEHTLKIAAKKTWYHRIRVYDVREQKMPDRYGVDARCWNRRNTISNTGSKQFDSITRNIIMSD
jgi:hypothetical protein